MIAKSRGNDTHLRPIPGARGGRLGHQRRRFLDPLGPGVTEPQGAPKAAPGRARAADQHPGTGHRRSALHDVLAVGAAPSPKPGSREAASGRGDFAFGAGDPRASGRGAANQAGSGCRRTGGAGRARVGPSDRGGLPVQGVTPGFGAAGAPRVWVRTISSVPSARFRARVTGQRGRTARILCTQPYCSVDRD